MASVNRRPLSARPVALQVPAVLSPLKANGRSIPLSSKRPCPDDTDPAQNQLATKRPRPVVRTASATLPTAVRDEDRRDKERKRAEREAQKEEFRVKYTRAFPSFVFYFDTDLLDSENVDVRDDLLSRVHHLGARVDDFFSNEISHVITNQPVPTDQALLGKENLQKKSMQLKSPLKLRGRPVEEESVGQSQSCEGLVQKALAFNMKIWSTQKLDGVLERCDVSSTKSSKQQIISQAPSANGSGQRSLTRLLASERLQGATTERDPTSRRHDFRYFTKGSYFVLVEDVYQELATIHATEYMPYKGRDGKMKGDWPVLHCHPHARGPFVEFDAKEQKRWEKSQRAEADKENERKRKVARELERKNQARLLSNKSGRDLRRSVSMNNLHRRATIGAADFVDLDIDFGDGQDSANASGYLASTGTGAYMAASGNSVGITSTAGTTSTAGGSIRPLDLPASLRSRLQQQVLTSRKAPTTITAKDQDTTHKKGTMGPPIGLPERPHGLLRKSRSTTTMRLPKRDEASKPGYCESCRVKFEDFDTHTRQSKHRKFAMDDSNYLQLDFLLSRVQRRTRQEVEERERKQDDLDSGFLDGSDPAQLLQSQSDAVSDEEIWEGGFSMSGMIA